MKRTSFVIFILFVLLHIEAHARSYSFLTGTVTELNRRWLVVKSDDGRVVQLKIGWKTVYSNRIPAVRDKVKVEYSIIRGVYIGHSVTILENTKEEIEPQKKAVEKRPPLPSNLQPEKTDRESHKKVVEKRPPLPSNLPPEKLGFAGKWEGFWDNIKRYGFTLTISNINLELEVAEVKYESKELQFSKRANVIPGEKPRIEWVVNSIANPDGPYVSPVTAGSKEYFAILTESIPIYYTFEIQKDGTLKGTFDSQRWSRLGTSRMALMRRVD